MVGAGYLPLFTMLPFKTYSLHFALGETPPADACRSITVHDGGGGLVTRVGPVRLACRYEPATDR